MLYGSKCMICDWTLRLRSKAVGQEPNERHGALAVMHLSRRPTNGGA